MATKSHILTDFDGMDECLHDEIHQRLHNRRYILYRSTIWQEEYIKHVTGQLEGPDPRPHNPNPIILRPSALIAYIALMTICFSFIPAVSYTNLKFMIREVPWLPGGSHQATLGHAGVLD